MARVPYPDPQTLSPDAQATLSKLPPLNNFRLLAGGDGLLRGADDPAFDEPESSPQQLQELTIMIGFSMTVSQHLETFGIEIEEAR
ncbi:MAG: hypothetical protein ACR2HQ_05860 [Ilumatobacteraceae bacterium]